MNPVKHSRCYPGSGGGVFRPILKEFWGLGSDWNIKEGAGEDIGLKTDNGKELENAA